MERDDLIEYVFHVVLVSKMTDYNGYTNYVFRNIETDDIFIKYFMCVRFPNWNHPPISEGEIGYVALKYVHEGKDEWFNGNEFVKYRYSNVIFLRFVPEDEYTTESFREIEKFEQETKGINEEDESDIIDSEETLE